MSESSFVQKLTAAIEQNNSLLCVGLDPDPRKYPDQFPSTITTEALVNWGRAIIQQTANLVCCYKPNTAFYEQYGAAGVEALRQTIAGVPTNIPVLLDVKRGDIGSTATAYARATFEVMQADAVTLAPYLGADSIAPFLAYPGKTAFVLCFTSNPSAAQIQEFGIPGPGEHLYEFIARQGQQWGSEAQIGFVVGATQPHALARVRQLAPKSWILAPGVGAQGGDLKAALAAGLDASGSGLIVPVSRSVIYADDPHSAAHQLRADINAARQNLPAAPAPAANSDLILQLHDAGCIQFGEFTLASGQQSPIYIDLRRMSSSAALLHRAAQAYAALLQPLSFDHLAAVPYAALAVGTAVALETGSSLIYPRKEVKAYGTGKSVEGVFAAGDSAVVIEDLVTSGGSVLTAIEQLQAADLCVTDVTVLIDREQGGPQNLAGAGFQLHAALQFSAVLEVLHTEHRISAEEFETVKNYLSQ